MYPTFADPTDSEEHTFVEDKPHWSTMKKKFIAAFSAITVIRPAKDEHTGRLSARDLMMRDSEPELTNPRWSIELEKARARVVKVEHDDEVSMFGRWARAVHDQETQPETAPLPSLEMAAPPVRRREPAPFYSFAEEQSALAHATMPVHRMAASSASASSVSMTRQIAAGGVFIGVFAAIALVATAGGSPRAIAGASAPRPTMVMAAPTSAPAITLKAPVIAPPAAPAITAPAITPLAEETRPAPLEHRFDDVVVPTIAPVAPVIAEVPVAAKVRPAKRLAAKRPVAAAPRSAKRAPIVVNTSTALGDLRPSRR